MLSDLLQQNLALQPHPLSEQQGKAPPPLGQICPYLALCERYKDHLVVKHSMIALAPEKGRCLCEACEVGGGGEEGAGQAVVKTAGNPPQQFTLPVGWAEFIHR